MGGRGSKSKQSRFLELERLRQQSGGGGGGADSQSAGADSAGKGGGWVPTDDEISQAFSLEDNDPEFTLRNEDFKNQFGTLPSRLTPSDMVDIENYIGFEYTDINNVMRGKRLSEYTPERQAELMATGLRVANLVTESLGSNTITFRGTNLTDDGDYAAAFTAGAVIRDKGLLSTSLSRQTAAGFVRTNKKNPVLFVVAMRKGSKVLPIDAARRMDYEYEVLPKYGSGLRVVRTLSSISRNGVTIPVVLVESVD